MGITVGELLNLEFFKDFQVIAGKKGLNCEVQGVTILDAPDGYRWAVGKELTLTSGYVFAHEPETLELYKKVWQPHPMHRQPWSLNADAIWMKSPRI